jgi:hypothetical protein
VVERIYTFAVCAMKDADCEIYMVADASGGTSLDARKYAMDRMVLMTPVDTGKPVAAEGSALAPLRHLVFSALWTATVVSNIGTWMQNAAAGWLMAGLTNDAFVVSLVQVATMLPVVLLGLPAGALADILDRRKLLIAVNGAQTITVAMLGMLVWLDRVTPEVLLIFTFLRSGCATAPTTGTFMRTRPSPAAWSRRFWLPRGSSISANTNASHRLTRTCRPGWCSFIAALRRHSSAT